MCWENVLAAELSIRREEAIRREEDLELVRRSGYLKGMESVKINMPSLIYHHPPSFSQLQINEFERGFRKGVDDGNEEKKKREAMQNAWQNMYSIKS
jgi:hypothetical protein